jgi:hypothetical protein
MARARMVRDTPMVGSVITMVMSDKPTTRSIIVFPR